MEVSFMKRKLMTIIATIIAIIAVLETSEIAVKAYDRCGYKGCSADNTSNGTIFCDKHAAEYAREKGYDYCDYSGCWGYTAKDSDYCDKHTCSHSKCTDKVVSGSSYCSTHAERKHH